MKKLLSLALACATVLTMSIPAFAAEQALEVKGTTNVPTIKMVMPTNAKGLVFNPYGLSVKYTPVKSGATEKTATTQIVAPTMFVKNLSTCDVGVKMSVTGTVGGNAKLMSGTAVAETKNSVCLALEAKIVDDETELTATAIGSIANTNAGQLILTTSKQEVKGFDKATTTFDKSNSLQKSADGTAAAAKCAYLALQFSGDCAKTPTIDWAKSDTVGANIAFTFVPLVDGTVTAWT